MNLKKPEDCNTIKEVRQSIDTLDRKILELFATRHKYVEKIVQFKNDEEGIVALNRKHEVIKERGNWAKANGLNGATFEKIYTLLVESNIKHELEIFRSKNKN